MACPVFTEDIEKQQHIRTFVSFSSVEEFPESTNPFRQRTSMPPISSPPADEGDDRTTTVVKPIVEPTPFSPLRLNVNCSPSQDSINANEGDERTKSVVKPTMETTPSSPLRLNASGSLSRWDSINTDEGNDCSKTFVKSTNEPTPSSPLQLNLSGSLSRWDSINTDEGDGRSQTVVKPTNEPTSSSPRRLDVSGSQSHWNVHDNWSPSFNNRRPGGGVPNRLDTSISPISLDMGESLGSAGRDHHDDDDMSVDTPSVATAVTANVSQVTPDDNRPAEEGRGRRSRSNSSGRARQRRYRRKTATRQPSPDTRRLVMCGIVWPNLNDEIRASMRDVADSIRQIFTTVKRFGPDEKEAVRETLLDAQYFIMEKIVKKCGNTLLSKRVACGVYDVMASFDGSDDGCMSPVRDSNPNGDTRARRVREGDTNRPTSDEAVSHR